MKLLLNICLLSISLWAGAQNVEFKIGESFPITKLHGIEKLIGTDGEFFYFKSFFMRKLTIYKVDKSFKLVGHVDYKLADIMKDLLEVDYQIIAGELYLFGVAASKEDKHLVMYKIKLNPSSMTFNSPEKMFDLNQKEYSYGGYYKFFALNTPIQMITSPDQSKFAFIVSKPVEENQEQAIRNAYVFNQKWEKLNEFEIPNLKKTGIAKYDVFNLENDGNLLMQLRLYESYHQFHYSEDKGEDIFQFISNGKLAFESDFKSTENKILKPKAFMGKSNIVVAGFYAKKGDKDNFPLGMSFMTYDFTGKMLSQSYNTFTPTYTEHMKKGITHGITMLPIKYGEIAKFLTMREIVFNADGSMIVIGEEHEIYYSGQATGLGGSTQYSKQNFHGYKLISKINSNGNFDWLSYIPSAMHIEGQRGKILVQDRNDKLNLLFSDNAANINADISQDAIKSFSYKPMAVANIEIDKASGKASRSILDDKNAKGNNYHIHEFLKLDKVFYIMTSILLSQSQFEVKFSSVEFK